MIDPLSPDTQAILLLTAPLSAGSGGSREILTPGEYKKLARHLHSIAERPATLLGPGAEALVESCRTVIEADRLRRLLGRGLRLSQALERWRARAIWVMSRADAAYPRRLRERLRDDAPPVLYGCGDQARLAEGGLAVVGSRNADSELIEFTQRIGALAAAARVNIVSGGARGIDSAAMSGALEMGGCAVGVLADGLEKAAIAREYREVLPDRLTLVSPYDPSAGFNVGHAMQRNKLIYALADRALVVSADVNKGGTWAGAVEQLERWRMVPVHVRTTGAESAGLQALRARGALEWPTVDSAEALRYASAPSVVGRVSENGVSATGSVDEDTERGRLLAMTVEPKSEREIIAGTGLTQQRVRALLAILVELGKLERRTRPVRYVARTQTVLLV